MPELKNLKCTTKEKVVFAEAIILENDRMKIQVTVKTSLTIEAAIEALLKLNIATHFIQSLKK